MEMATGAVPLGVEGFLVHRVDKESEGFWEGTARGELRLQACGSCGDPPVSSTGHVPTLPIDRAPLAAGVGHRNDLVVRGLSSTAPAGLCAVCSVPGDHGDVGRGSGVAHGGESGHRARWRNQRIDPATIVIGEPVRAVFSGRRGPDGTEVFLPVWVRTTDEIAGCDGTGSGKSPDRA